MENIKICTKCKQALPATTEFFHRHKIGKYGLRSKCKKCRYEYEIKPNKEKLLQNARKWKKSNSGRVKQSRKKYYEEHKEEELTNMKKYQDEHREEIAEQRKTYIENNKEKIKKTQKRYYEENKEAIFERNKKWNERNKDKIRMIDARKRHKRQAIEKTLPADFSEKQWNECKLYFNNKCSYCGKNSTLQQEHFIPVSKGGEYTLNNIIPACQSCNSSKNNKSFFDWYSGYKYYDKDRENKILNYLGYNEDNIQQLSIL